ncbi:MAG TPA: LLM class flavin-dependent oxidoreductase [Acidimicrobiia bacterium]|nr:LLM class flavin-dependent oxidoreductase [Acidimicrobiia bacterium]
MKFSMIFEAQLAFPTREHEREVLHDCVEQAVLAEEMGFDRVWSVEHHSLLRYAHLSAPEVFLSFVAAKTSRIRIGHGVVCLPFNYNHPIRVAERAATLDVLSGGRLDLGAGRGATLQEMSAFGVDPHDTYPQLEESLRMIGHMWDEDEFEWHGDLLDVDPHPIIPRPVQEPHPPLYLACTKRDTVTLAAELGVGALVLGFSGPDEIAVMGSIYDETRASRTGDRFVSTVVNDHFSALCPAIVLDDRDEALRMGTRGQRFFAEGIAHWYGAGPPPEDDPHDEVEQVKHEMAADADRIVAMLHEAEIPVQPATTGIFNPEHAYGTADDAIAYLERLRQTGADEVMFLIQMGTVPQSACMATIRNLGEHVLPHFRELEKRGDGDVHRGVRPAAASRQDV